MIRSLRRLHPWLVGAVGVAAGSLAIAGLTDRTENPRIELPPPIASPALPSDAVWQILLDGETTIRVLRTNDALLVRTEGVLETPEPRLFWIPAGEDATRERSLGGLRGRGVERLAAPSGAGRLVLKSLGHDEVLADLAVTAEGAF